MKYLMVVIYFFMLYYADAQQVIELYDGVAPGSEKWTWEEGIIEPAPGQRLAFNVTRPTITVFRASEHNRTGAAILVAPGGAFHILSMDNEGELVAKFLNELGIDAFVLKYRLSRTYGNDPIQQLMPLMNDLQALDSINTPTIKLATADGIQALKLIHEMAADGSIDMDKIGMMGFSAGATLTMSVLLSSPSNLKANLVAPIYLYKPAVIGNDYPDSPTPMFIAVASDDGLKFVPHSINLYEEWIEKGHPTELHIYENGDHGFGMSKKGTTSDHWTADFTNWLVQRKWTN